MHFVTNTKYVYKCKGNKQPTSNEQEQPERNPTSMDPPECNTAEIKVNSVDIAPKSYSWMQLTKFLSYPIKIIKDPTQLAYPKTCSK